MTTKTTTRSNDDATANTLRRQACIQAADEIRRMAGWVRRDLHWLNDNNAQVNPATAQQMARIRQAMVKMASSVCQMTPEEVEAELKENL